MSFIIHCPTCGSRAVTEFRFGGERLERPDQGASELEWSNYLYSRRNERGEQSEWWYHRLGCRRWVIALRDTVENQVGQITRPEGS